MKTIILSLLMLGSLFATGITERANYDIDFSVVGTIAKASVERELGEKDYIITLNAKAVGVAADLTKNKKEMYISQGSIVKGELIPDVLVILRRDDKQEKFTIFKFNHTDKTIEVDSIETKEVRETSLDIASLRIITTTKVEFSSSTQKNDYYAQNDIVSLFFNAKHYTNSMKQGEQKSLHAVGIKTDEGQLMINLPNNTHIGQSIFGIAVSQDIFEDDNGQLIVKLDSDGFPNSARMNNVALYGDVTSRRINTAISSN